MHGSSLEGSERLRWSPMQAKLVRSHVFNPSRWLVADEQSFQQKRTVWESQGQIQYCESSNDACTMLWRLPRFQLPHLLPPDARTVGKRAFVLTIYEDILNFFFSRDWIGNWPSDSLLTDPNRSTQKLMFAWLCKRGDLADPLEYAAATVACCAL